MADLQEDMNTTLGTLLVGIAWVVSMLIGFACLTPLTFLLPRLPLIWRCQWNQVFDTSSIAAAVHFAFGFLFAVPYLMATIVTGSEFKRGPWQTAALANFIIWTVCIAFSVVSTGAIWLIALVMMLMGYGRDQSTTETILGKTDAQSLQPESIELMKDNDHPGQADKIV